VRQQQQADLRYMDFCGYSIGHHKRSIGSRSGDAFCFQLPNEMRRYEKRTSLAGTSVSVNRTKSTP